MPRHARLSEAVNQVNVRLVYISHRLQAVAKREWSHENKWLVEETIIDRRDPIMSLPTVGIVLARPRGAQVA